MIGNAFAYMMLVAWPALVVILFGRLDRASALVWSLLAGYLVLPPVVQIALPLQPELDKVSSPSLAAALCLGAAGARPVEMPRSGLARLLIGLFVLSPALTSLANQEPLIEGMSYRPPFGFYDALSGVLNQGILVLPLLMGRAVLRTPEAPRLWLGALAAAGLAYSLPMLLEVRLSPQLNVWVYGFFAHDFSQSLRYGGYRPMVFLAHGLWVAMFAFASLGAAAALARADGFPARRIGLVLWLALTLVLCKSMASILYAAVALPLILLAAPRVQLGVAATLAAAVLAYPLLRATGLVPVDTLVAAAAAFDPDRAASLAFRLDNESRLLAHAMLKPLVGWGSWGRHLLVDPATGEFSTISDGRWIIALGTAGILGFVAEFGLLALPLFTALRIRAARGDRLVAAIALTHGFALIDLIPNATGTPLTLLTAGLLIGQLERLARASQAAEALSGPGPGPAGRGPALTAPALPQGRPPAIRTLL